MKKTLLLVLVIHREKVIFKNKVSAAEFYHPNPARKLDPGWDLVYI